MTSTAIEYSQIIELGPRRITRVGGRPAVYLPKEFELLMGRKAIVILKLLPISLTNSTISDKPKEES